MSGIDKKGKRKLITSHAEKTSMPLAAKSITPIQDVFLLEEAEALKRNSDKDLDNFKATCKDIKEIVDKVFDAKKLKNYEKIPQYQSDVCYKFVTMKKLNRLDKHRIKHGRDCVADSKQKVDGFDLQLQNLQYEVIHLQKEASKCLDFRSRDEEIDLISKEEFYKEAPESISRPEVNKNDAHQETLARLEYELADRKKLAGRYTKMDQKKKTLVQEIAKKQDSLAKLQPTLKSILHATHPLHAELGLPLQSTQLTHKAANYLPMSLYILYVQACSYKETLDPLFEATIQGNVEEAKLQPKNDIIDDDSGDSDGQEEQTNRHRRSTKKKDTSGSKLVLAKHPLSILITIKTKEEYSLVLEFFFYTNLHIVTVKVIALHSPPNSSSVAAAGVLKANTLLHDLMGPDNGEESPNPSNLFFLKKHGVTLNSAEIGSFYRWTQKMAGLQFLSSDPSKPSFKNDHSIASSYMEDIVNALRERFLSRISLNSQLLSLERGLIPLPPHITNMFPNKIGANLKSWRVSYWDDLMKDHTHILEMAEKEIVSEHDFVYEFVLERGSARMSGYALIPSEYPKKTPVFLVSVYWQSQRFPHNDGALWELEKDVNLFPLFNPDLKSSLNHIISIQLQKLLVNFDIYLETGVKEDMVEGPREFSLDRVFLRNARGPSRSKPYHYIPNLCVFSHDE